MDWRILCIIVCTFGFFKELRPSEAYLTPYLTGEWKNLTIEEVDNEIYPWWTYSYLLWLLPVFLLTDFLRYKPMLILDGLAYIGTWALLLWAQGVPLMKLMQVTYGLATAGEIGYYSYLYAKVTADHFNKVASFTRAATLIGKFVAYLMGQLFVSFDVMNFYHLNFISFGSVCFAFLIALFLPRARYSEIFHQYRQHTEEQENVADDLQRKTNVQNDRNQTCSRKLHSGILFLWGELKVIYSSRPVILWSLWWALASCGNFQVGNYIQNLWSIIAPHKESRKLYNGAVEAAGTLVSSISVLLIGFLPIDWSIRGRGEILMAAVCALNAAMLVIIARTSEIWVAYVLYDIFRATYQIVITIATAQIAKSLTRQRYGFVFGCNMFLALLIETILTAIVVDEAGFGVDVQTQFEVYGGYFAFMAVLFLIVAIVSISRQRCWRRNSADISE